MTMKILFGDELYNVEKAQQRRGEAEEPQTFALIAFCLSAITLLFCIVIM